MITRETPPHTRPAESMKDCRVLIAVERPSFQRLLEHVVQGGPGLRLVGGSSRGVSPAHEAARLAPNVIILSTRLKERAPGEVLAELKRSCPASTLILLTHALGEPVPLPDADVCLPEDAVVTRLLPTIRKAALRAASRTPRLRLQARVPKEHPMKRLFRRSLVLATAFVAFSGVEALAASAAATSSSSLAPPIYDTFMPPAKGGTYADPAFGTSVKRLSDAMNMTDNAGSGGLTTVGTEYSTASPFNSDNSRLILQHNSYFGLYDGNGTYLRDLPFAVNVSTEPRWSRTDPNVLFYVSGNNFMRLDVANGASSLVHAFAEYGAISGKGESDISRDGDHFVFAGDGRYVFVFEISTNRKGTVLDTAGHAFDDLYIASDNSVVIGWIPAGTSRFTGVELFDRNMTFQRQLTHALGHMHLTRDTNGGDVLVWTNSNDAQPIACQNGIVKVRLSDASQTCLLELDWSLAVHITAPDGNGWVFVETYAPSNPFPQSTAWAPYANEILQVKLDGSVTQRLVHHRSRPFDSYVYQPRATVSRDGSKLVFSSNQNLQAILGYPNLYSDAYMVNVSGSIPANEASPDSNPAPAPSPSPSPSDPSPTTPAPAPPMAGQPIHEQDSSAVSYAGTWSSNQQAGHSGGVAYLTMDAGNQASFVFTGTSASWIGYRDEWSGIATVRVDGVVMGSVDTYSSPQQAQASVYSVGGLSNGVHTLTIEATGTHNGASAGSWIWVDAFTTR